MLYAELWSQDPPGFVKIQRIGSYMMEVWLSLHCHVACKRRSLSTLYSCSMSCPHIEWSSMPNPTAPNIAGPTQHANFVSLSGLEQKNYLSSFPHTRCRVHGKYLGNALNLPESYVHACSAAEHEAPQCQEKFCSSGDGRLKYSSS
jgi:hypothetical protein